MIKIGLVGEDPKDTKSIKALLSKRYEGKVQFVTMFKNMKGDGLESGKARKMLKIECATHKPDAVLFIRDLDGIRTEQGKIKQREAWYNDLSKEAACEKTLLLNIYELEALILSDIDTFNAEYKTDLKAPGDVTMVEKPKELLKRKTFKNPKRFHENDCPDLFAKMNLDKVEAACEYFRNFLKTFEQLLIN